jgi:lipid-binding SYLF domain-containing protein
LGGDASVAAGPVGRTAAAETDIEMKAEILAWSRTQGVFAGVSLNGAVLHPDEDVNADLYGNKMSNREILMGNTEPPEAAHRLIAELDRYPMHRHGEASRSKPEENHQ